MEFTYQVDVVVLDGTTEKDVRAQLSKAVGLLNHGTCLRLIKKKEDYKQKGTWGKLVSILNNARGDCSIYRRTLLQLMGYEKTSIVLSQATIDSYRAYLTAAGYVRVLSRGKYKVVKKISGRLTVSQCIKKAYGGKYASKI